jgi:hypothetical protein
MSNPFSDNPYQPPAQMAPPTIPPGAITVMPCYRCHCPYATKISWTLWGGALGPWMLNHVQCVNCKTKFNGKTGQSNDTAIMIYVGVSLAIGLGLAVVGIVIKALN